jgi:DDE superfamily endonuclease
MILQLRRWLPGRKLVVVADSGYAVLELLAACVRLVNPVVMITRLRLDAALYDPAPSRPPGARGRPRIKGDRQPTLAARLADPASVWQRCQVSWYGGSAREVELASGTAVWYHGGLPVVPIRWVLIRDPLGQFEAQALLCTDLTETPAQIVAWFVLRWHVEVTFEEVRRHLGLETQRQWSDLAILRTTPVRLGLFSRVTWLVQGWLQGKNLPTPPGRLVPEGDTDLLGCPGLLALGTPARQDDLAVVCPARHGGHPRRAAGVRERHAGFRDLSQP